MNPSYSGEAILQAHIDSQYCRLGCDLDGWNFQANKEDSFDTFLHVLSPGDVIKVAIIGDLEIGYIGFGDSKSPRRVRN